MNWEEELLKLFDTEEFADIKAPVQKKTSSDRLINSFLEVVSFVEANNREPQEDGTINEMTLSRTLSSIRKDEKKRAKCLPYDTLGLLKEKEKTIDEQLMELFNDPLYDTSSEVQGMFDVPEYMKKASIDRPDYIAQRVPCDNFDEKYAARFKDVHAKLNDGRYKLVKFKDEHLKEGAYFVVDGILVLLDKIEGVKKKRDYKLDGRTLCIYENGLQSDVLLQSLAKSIYSDGYSVRDMTLSDNDHLKKQFTVTESDVPSGHIYVLRSKSTDPEIASIKDLYKIGFTTQTVEERIANAKNDATYLFADVEVVASWQVFNVKAVAFENLIHKLFSHVQLKLSAGDSNPKEWFVVPLPIIEQAVNYIIGGQPIAYDAQLKQIVLL